MTSTQNKGAETSPQTKSENEHECAYSSNGLPKLKDGPLLRPESPFIAAFGLDRKGK